MQTATSRPFYRSRWWRPLFSVFLGLLILGAFALGGNVRDGFMSFGVMLALAVAILLGSRSEIVRGLAGQGRDERWAMIDIHATALTGMVLVTVIIGAWLVEIARGEDGMPYSALGAVGGVAYVVFVLLLRRRS
jgi:hypothetical protein